MIGPRLRIISFNDVYALDNLPRMKTLVEHHRVTDPADVFLVTLAGDFLAPSILSSIDSGRGMVDCLNAVGVTHVIFGNHEDDISMVELHKRVAELHATWLDTNVRTFDPSMPPSCILEVGHAGSRIVRVGMLGVVMNDSTVYRDKPFGGADVIPANESATREATRLLEKEKCACVIPLTHQSMDDDRDLAKQPISRHFPVIIGGHEHVPFEEQVEGTWIVKAGMDAVNALVLDFTWPGVAPANGDDMPAVNVLLEPVKGYTADPDLHARVEVHMAQVHRLQDATLMTLTPGQVLTSIGTRAKQTSMGSLICSRLRDTLGAECALFNGGGIRGAHEYHRHVTYGDLEAEVPFDNEIVVARLPGSLVIDAVRQSRSHAPAESGGFLQVDDGLTVDATNTVTHVRGAPIDPSREYRVAMIRNLFDGMDHVEPFVRFARENPDKIPPHGSGREVKILLASSFAVSLWRALGGFDAVDVNHDGVVTREEIMSAVSRVTNEAPSSITADLVLRAIDANRDLSVSREESDAAQDTSARASDEKK